LSILTISDVFYNLKNLDSGGWSGNPSLFIIGEKKYPDPIRGKKADISKYF